MQILPRDDVGYDEYTAGFSRVLLFEAFQVFEADNSLINRIIIAGVRGSWIIARYLVKVALIVNAAETYNTGSRDNCVWIFPDIIYLGDYFSPYSRFFILWNMG